MIRSLKKIITFTLIFIFLILISFLIDKSISPKMENDNITYEHFFNDAIKRRITIKITQDEWNEFISQNTLIFKSNYMAKAELIYQDVSGQYATYSDVGIRTKGNDYSRTIPAHDDGTPKISHFKLDFNETFNLEEGDGEYNAISNRKIFGLQELDLKYNSNGWWLEAQDTTFINEVFAFDLLNEIGVYAPQATFGMFYIQIGDQKAVNLGLYKFIEPINEDFVNRRLINSNKRKFGSLYKGRYSANLTPIPLNQVKEIIGETDWKNSFRPPYTISGSNDVSNHEHLLDFIDVIDSFNYSSEEEFTTKIESKMDMDYWLKYLALTFLIGNHDDYRFNQNNSYFYFNQDGKFYYLPYDFDHGFGQGWDGGYDDYGYNIDLYTGVTGYKERASSAKSPLADYILSIDKYQKIYEQYLTEFISENGVFQFDKYYDHYLMIKNMYENQIYANNSPHLFDETKAKNWYSKKIENVKKQLSKND